MALYTVGAERFSFAVGAASTTALAYAAEGAIATLALAHGAGAPQTHPFMVAMAEAIAARGVEVVTFDFLYARGPRRAPDRNDVLETTWLAAIEAVRGKRPGPARLFLGGKSMGGRIATQVAARDEVSVEGLVLLGYPLHPPGKPEQLRKAHLPRVRAPMLFVQGSRDAFGTPAELAPVLDGLAAGTRLFVIEGGDHSFGLPKSRGESPDQTRARIADEVVRFIASR
jgi:predicted alpha/beta-hydrolase family hydrolase